MDGVRVITPNVMAPPAITFILPFSQLRDTKSCGVERFLHHRKEREFLN